MTEYDEMKGFFDRSVVDLYTAIDCLKAHVRNSNDQHLNQITNDFISSLKNREYIKVFSALNQD